MFMPLESTGTTVNFAPSNWCRHSLQRVLRTLYVQTTPDHEKITLEKVGYEQTTKQRPNQDKYIDAMRMAWCQGTHSRHGTMAGRVGENCGALFPPQLFFYAFDIAFTVQLLPANRLGDGFCWIPPGPWFVSAEGAITSRRPQQAHVRRPSDVTEAGHTKKQDERLL